MLCCWAVATHEQHFGPPDCLFALPTVDKTPYVSNTTCCLLVVQIAPTAHRPSCFFRLVPFASLKAINRS